MQPKRPWSALLEELRDLCATKSTGTLFILSPGNNVAQFTLEAGEIIAVAYNTKRGEDALKLICKIPVGSARFERNIVLAAKMPLASTATLLGRLAGQTHDAYANQATMIQSRLEACQLMTDVTSHLLEEFGDRGFGRTNVVNVLRNRLRRLRTSHPCLAQVDLLNDKIDFAPLSASAVTAESLAQAWEALLHELYQSAIENMGHKVAGQHYQKVHHAYNAESQKIWIQLGATNPLPPI